MDWVIGAKGSGKTTHIVRMASRYNCDVIVATEARARDVEYMAHELRMKVPGIFTIHDVVSGLIRNRHNPVIFDDVQDCLQVLCLGNQVKGGTLGIGDGDQVFSVKTCTDEIKL